MEQDQRKAAVSDYKKRKVLAGLFAIRSASDGGIWVGTSADISAAQNREWFALGIGSHMNKSLQAAWTQGGANDFSFEVLESFEEADAHVRNGELKRRRALWCAELGATAI